MPKKKNKKIGNTGITEEEKRVGSQKCVLKAVQLMATIDELEKRQVPMRGWVDQQLDDLVRELETDPFSRNSQSPSADAMLPADYGFTSLVYETLFSQAVAWWAKAQNTNQQKDKYLQNKMYSSASWFNHFMERRNNLGSHFPNDERFQVPGERWLIARGYYPIGNTIRTAFKYILAESMSLLVTSEHKDETLLRMCLDAFGISQISIFQLQLPDISDPKTLSLIVHEPSPLLYHIIPLLSGQWVAEAWEVDASGAIVAEGQYFNLDPEIVCKSPVEAFTALSAKIEEERT